MVSFQKIFNLFFEPALLIWFLIVYCFYIFFHDYPLLPAIGGILGILFYLLFKVLKISELTKKRNFELYVWQIVVLFVFGAIFLGIFFNSIFSLLDGTFDWRFFLGWLNLSGMIIFKLFFLAWFTLIAFSLGKKTFSFFHFSLKLPAEEFLFSTGIGFVVILLFSFFLGILHLFYFWIILLVALLVTLAMYGEIQYFLQKFLFVKCVFRIPQGFKDLDNIIRWAVVAMIIFFLLTFFQTLYTLPSEYDDLDTYFSVPYLYSQYHGSVPFYNSVSAVAGGIVMFFYGLLDSFLPFHFVYQFSWLFLWLMILALYIFTKKFFPINQYEQSESRTPSPPKAFEGINQPVPRSHESFRGEGGSAKIAILTAFFSVLVPWNIVFTSTQKVDFIFVFYSILAVLSFFNWIFQKEIPWLWLTMIFLGFSINIKMNGLFLALSIFLILLFFLLRKKISLKVFLASNILFIIFLLPMFVYNFYYYKNPLAPFSIPFFSQKKDMVFHLGKQVPTLDVSNTNLGYRIGNDVTELTRQNAASNSRIINFLWLWWNIIINQKGFNYVYSEAGPFLLIFLPFFFLYFFKDTLYKNQAINYLLALSIIFLAVWYFRGHERIWYGISIYYFLFIFCSWVIVNIQRRVALQLIFLFVFLFFFRNLSYSLSLIYLDSSQITQHSNFNFISIQKSELPPIYRFYNYVNKEVIGKNKDARILMVPESRTAFLKEWDKKIIADHWAVYWGKILEEGKNFQGAYEILKEQKITHIIFSNAFYFWLQSFNNGIKNYIVFDDFEKFEGFKENFLNKKHCEQNLFCIYEIRRWGK